jgi:C1A family cysteine protease
MSRAVEPLPHMQTALDHKLKYNNLGDYPESWDSRDKYVAPVRNQEGCGSCWAFSAVSCLETAYWRLNSEPLFFSEQQLVDCVEYGCQGGHYTWAWDYIMKKGIPSRADYPYVGGVSNFQSKNSMKILWF